MNIFSYRKRDEEAPDDTSLVRDVMPRDGRMFLDLRQRVVRKIKKHVPIIEIHFEEIMPFMREHRHSLSVIAITLIFISSFSYFGRSHASVVDFYPTTCLGGWKNPQNAQGAPGVDPTSPLERFSTGNSAMLENSTAEIYCGTFQGDVPKDTLPKKFVLSFNWSVDDGSVVHDKETPFGSTPETNNGGGDTKNSNPEVPLPTNDTSSVLTAPLNFIPNESTTPPVQSAPAPEPTPAPVPDAVPTPPPADSSPQSFLNIFSTAKVFAQDATASENAPAPLGTDSSSSVKSAEEIKRMHYINVILIILGLAIFEIVSSIDNAVINAEILDTMSPRGRRWFMLWGFLFAVFAIRGLLPWVIIWATNPMLGPIGALTATFSSDPLVAESIARSAPLLLAGGGIFLIFLFLHWLFLEPKAVGLRTERFFLKQGVWFFGVSAIILSAVVWYGLKTNPMMAFGAVIGSTAFFIMHGFKENAEKAEKKLKKGEGGQSDLSKILYLEIIDASFSIDGILGAFAFTLSVPYILIGNGIGAWVLRELTVKNIETIKKYKFLKNGAMYAIGALSIIMLLGAFGHEIPEWVSPLVMILIVGHFFLKSKAKAV